MKLIVGLGNPTEAYQNTRHNIGFMALDYFLKDKNHSFKKKFQGLFVKETGAFFLKPMTYMNLSGESVKKAAQYYDISLSDIIIIYDDLDLEPGVVKIKKNGSSGGHNGLKSIFSHFQTESIQRIKIGIGKKGQAKDYVLSPIPKSETEVYETAFKKIAHIIQDFIDGKSMEALMNTYQNSDSPSL